MAPASEHFTTLDELGKLQAGQGSDLSVGTGPETKGMPIPDDAKPTPLPEAATPITPVTARARARWRMIAGLTKTMGAMRRIGNIAQLRKVCERGPWGGVRRVSGNSELNTRVLCLSQVFGRTSLNANYLDSLDVGTKYMVHPEQPWRKHWDLIMVCRAGGAAGVLGLWRGLINNTTTRDLLPPSPRRLR